MGVAEDLVGGVVEVAMAAGAVILEVYRGGRGGVGVETKGDGSPVTVADKRADALIREGLGGLGGGFPCLSEETVAPSFAEREGWGRFWLVDPLDGTKSFVAREGEFTVNIALMEGNEPVLGVVYEPLEGVAYYATVGGGAFKRGGAEGAVRLRCRGVNGGRAGIVMVASRSHGRSAVREYEGALRREFGGVEVVRMSSSKKVCLVAEGGADVYPRLGPTSEWDTAAAQCVLEAAGGGLTDVKGGRLRYNKADLENPWFLAFGDGGVDWGRFVG